MSLHPRPSCASHPGIKLKRVSTEEAISFPSGLMYELPRHSALPLSLCPVRVSARSQTTKLIHRRMLRTTRTNLESIRSRTSKFCQRSASRNFLINSSKRLKLFACCCTWMGMLTNSFVYGKRPDSTMGRDGWMSRLSEKPPLKREKR